MTSIIRTIKTGAALAFVGALLLSSPAVLAKPATINDITMDIPEGYTIESSERGILAKTPDGEVDVWIETYMPDEEDTVIGEHERYWKKEKVVLAGDPVKSSKDGNVPVRTTAWNEATWKGDPTIVRYVALGPVGPKKEMVLITYWASPEGDKEHNANIGKMVETLNVKIAQ